MKPLLGYKLMSFDKVLKCPFAKNTTDKEKSKTLQDIYNRRLKAFDEYRDEVETMSIQEWVKLNMLMKKHKELFGSLENK